MSSKKDERNIKTFHSFAYKHLRVAQVFRLKKITSNKEEHSQMVLIDKIFDKSIRRTMANNYRNDCNSFHYCESRIVFFRI